MAAFINQRYSRQFTFSSFVVDHEQFNVSLWVLSNLFTWKTVNSRFVNLSDGAGLFCGVIKQRPNRGRECPIVLFATRFHETLNEGMLSPTRIPISFVHMAVLLATGDGDILNYHGSSVLDFSNLSRSIDRIEAKRWRRIFIQVRRQMI